MSVAEQKSALKERVDKGMEILSAGRARYLIPLRRQIVASPHLSTLVLAEGHQDDIAASKGAIIRRAMTNWLVNNADAQPQQYSNEYIGEKVAIELKAMEENMAARAAKEPGKAAASHIKSLL